MGSVNQLNKIPGEACHEAARLFPQQRVLPGQNRLEPEGFRRRPPAPSSAQGRAARSRLSRHQPARPGADAAGRGRHDHHPVTRHHRMAGRNPPRPAAVADRSAAPRARPRLCASPGLRHPPGTKFKGVGAAAAARPARGAGDRLGGLGQPRGAVGLRNIDRRRTGPILLRRRAHPRRPLSDPAARKCAAVRRRCRSLSPAATGGSGFEERQGVRGRRTGQAAR